MCAAPRCCWVRDRERAVEHVYVYSYVCFVYTALESSGVSSRARSKVATCVRVKRSKQPKRRPEWRMAKTYEVESFVHGHHVFNRVTRLKHTMCESSYILYKREGSNTNDLYAVAVVCVGARVYMRARTCSLRTYAQIIILARI